MQIADTRAAQASLMVKVRQFPSDADARMQLFRYCVIDGNWERAASQLAVASDLDAALAHTAMVYRRNIQCELHRHAVMHGRADCLFLGQPPAWAGYLTQAVKSADPHASAALIHTAMEQAEAIPGCVNGQPFQWLADADSRFGPMMEMFIDGKYYWVPFEAIARVTIAQPADLLDLAWCPCELALTNGGACNGFIPTRYPGTEAMSNDDLKFARLTQWLSWADDVPAGAGQRMFASEHEEYALLDCREIIFTHQEGHA